MLEVIMSQFMCHQFLTMYNRVLPFRFRLRLPYGTASSIWARHGIDVLGRVVRVKITRDPFTGRLEPATSWIELHDVQTGKHLTSFNYTTALEAQAKHDNIPKPRTGEMTRAETVFMAILVFQHLEAHVLAAPQTVEEVYQDIADEEAAEEG